MYSKNKKMIYGLGFIGVLAIPTATIISCGTNDESALQEEEQEQLNKITPAQVIEKLGMQEKGTTDKMASSVVQPVMKSNIEINKLNKVTLSINDDWDPSNVEGSVNFSVTAARTQLKSKVINVTIGGYNQEQKLFNSINEDDVISAIGWTINKNERATVQVVELEGTAGEFLDTVAKGIQVDITISNAVAGDSLGEINFHAQIKGHHDIVPSENKDYLQPKEMNIKIEGFEKYDPSTFHQKLQEISASEVLDAIGIKGDPNKWADTAVEPDDAGWTGKTINGIDGITVKKISFIKGNRAYLGTTLLVAELSVPAEPLYGMSRLGNIIIDGYKIAIENDNINDPSFVTNDGNGKLIINRIVKTISLFDVAGVKLTTLEFQANSNLEKIDPDVFKTFSIGGDLVLPAKLKTLGHSAFEISDFDSISFGNQLETIGDEVFMGTHKTTTLTIPKTVTKIGEETFENLPLTSLTFYGDVPTTGRQLILGRGAFVLTPINAIFGEEWQKWATDNYALSFLTS